MTAQLWPARLAGAVPQQFRLVSGLVGRRPWAILGELVHRLGGQLSQALDMPDEIALAGGELVPSAVIGCARLLEAVADIVHILEKLDEFVVDAAGTLGNRLGVAVAAL